MVVIDKIDTPFSKVVDLSKYRGALTSYWTIQGSRGLSQREARQNRFLAGHNGRDFRPEHRHRHVHPHCRLETLGISVILALAYMAVVVMTMQELTLPQRLWIHRSIFGQHNRRYYNSEPFGGDKPTSASAEERKEYQRRALNEEAQALAMLVAGITLEVSKTRIIEGATAIIPKFDSTEKIPL